MFVSLLYTLSVLFYIVCITSPVSSSKATQLHNVTSLPSSHHRHLTSTSLASSSTQDYTTPSTRLYSKFWCIGGRGRENTQNDRSCRFQNLCYRASTNVWLYYQDPKEKAFPVLLDKGRVIHEFPQAFLNLRSIGIPKDAQYWAPTVINDGSTIPSSAFTSNQADANDHTPASVHILYHPHYPSNLGHTLGDDFFPLFNLMASFGMLVKDAQLIMSRDCAQIYAGNPSKVKLCQQFLNMLSPGMSARPILAATDTSFIKQVSSHTGSAATPDLICFENVLLGIGPWGFQQSIGKAPTWWAFRSFYLTNIGLNPNKTPKKQRITVSIKKGKRALANTEELVAHLKKTFPDIQVDALELKALGGWKEELAYLADTTVLITPCGGVSMSSMFLPHNSALIVVDYYHVHKQMSIGMEDRLWSNLGYVRPFHYPFKKEEVELPAGKDSSNFQDMRDYGQVRVDLERMTIITKAALKHVDNFMVMEQQ